MTVAVTGGSGVVGQALVRHLVADGHEVRMLSRSHESAMLADALGARAVPGDVLEPGSLRPLVADCEFVFHVAGVNELCVSDSSLMEKVNVAGVRNVVAASRAAGVGRLVHTSSAVTIGERRGEVASEETTHRGYFLSEYERTKFLGERELYESAGDLDFVVVNPSSVQGPGRATGTGRIVLNVINGGLPVLIDSTISIVDIDDCARGHILAATAGARGERYILNGSTLTVREAVLLAGEAAGRPVEPRFVPSALVAGLVAVAEPIGRLFGRELPFCREMIRVMRFGHHYDGSRATRELGLSYRSIEDTLSRLMAWFESQGLLESL